MTWLLTFFFRILLNDPVHLEFNCGRSVDLTVLFFGELLYRDLNFFAVSVCLFCEPDDRDTASKDAKLSVGIFHLLSKQLDSFVACRESHSKNGFFFFCQHHFFLVILILG